MLPVIRCLRAAPWYSPILDRSKWFSGFHTTSLKTTNLLICPTDSLGFSPPLHRLSLTKNHRPKWPQIRERRICFGQRRSATTSTGNLSKVKSLWYWRQKKEYVHIGGNGNVELEIYIPQRATESTTKQDLILGTQDQCLDNAVEVMEHKGESQESQANSTLIYLPPGLFPRDSSVEVDNELEFQSLLSLLAQSEQPAPTVVRLKYRLQAFARAEESFDGRFPTAIHDCVTCLDWILDHQSQWLSQDLSSTTSKPSHDFGKQQVSLCGTHIGGGIALTLALTTPKAIRSVAVIDPVVDWVGLDEVAALDISDSISGVLDIAKKSDERLHDVQLKKSRVQRTKETAQSKKIQALVRSQTAQAMIGLRTSIFRTPSGFFDPFASPILFLRAPGKDTPLWKSARPEQKTLKTRESTLAYGPYDDDWQGSPLESQHVPNHTDNEDRQIQQDLDTITEALGADAAAWTDGRSSSTDGLQHRFTTTDTSDSTYTQSETNLPYPTDSSVPLSPDLSSQASEPTVLSTVRRRKTLKRWPPVGRPEEVLLPYVRIISIAPNLPEVAQSRSVDLPYVLHAQAREMVDVMRRACFWGREKGLSEQRVSLEIYEESTDGRTAAAVKARMERVWSWLRQVPKD